MAFWGWLMLGVSEALIRGGLTRVKVAAWDWPLGCAALSSLWVGCAGNGTRWNWSSRKHVLLSM